MIFHNYSRTEIWHRTSRKNKGYKFGRQQTTRECGSHRTSPTIPRNNIDQIVTNGNNLINELNKGNAVSDIEQLCNYRDLKNLNDWMKTNLRDDTAINQSDDVKNKINPLINKIDEKLPSYSNYGSGTTTDWGEVCRSGGIYPQDCQFNEVETDCNNWKYGYAGKYDRINITKNNKYNGTCQHNEGQTINTGNCHKINVKDWFSSTIDTISGIGGDLMSGDIGGAAGGVVEVLSSY